MKRCLLFIRLSFLFAFSYWLIPHPGYSATYYVNTGHPSSDDANPGTLDEPWLTLQHAAYNVLPGDTVYVYPGSYQDVTFTTSGTENQPITFIGTSRETVIISGSIEFSTGTAYMNIANFTVRDYSEWGVFLRGNNHHIRMSGLTVIGGEACIRITYGYQAEDPQEGPVSDVILENSLLKDCLYTALDGTPGPCNRMTFRNLEVMGAGIAGQADWSADGIAIERGSHILVEDCYVHDNSGDGIDLCSRDFNGNMQGIIVRRNCVVRNYQMGIKLWAGGRIENNVVWGQGNCPVWIGTYVGTYELINNTIAYNMRDPAYSTRNYAFAVAWDYTGISAQVHLRMVNNIFAFNSSDPMGGPTGIYLGTGVTLVQEGHNLYYSRIDGEIEAAFVAGDTWFSRDRISDGSWAAATGQGTGNVVQDPLFISGWPNPDLHITPGSPAIDAGLSIEGLTTDSENHPRPSGNGYDIGAYEYQHDTRISLPIHTRRTHPPDNCSIRNYPNPFNAETIIEFFCPLDGFVDLSIYDMKGRRIKSLIYGNPTAGKYQIHWDGKTDTGVEAASGMYFCLLKTNNVRKEVKLLILR